MIAVLTGDIVYSTSAESSETWLPDLKEIFARIEDRFELTGNGAEMHRGDGFQLGLHDPRQALRVAFIIRAGLIKSTKTGLKMDTRIAIGIGEYAYLENSVNESFGDAFTRSGHALDEMKNTDDRLALSSDSADFDSEMYVSLTFADMFIKNWSQADAEIAWYIWMEDLTQSEIAKELNISQPAVSKRKKRAHIDEFELLLNRFETKTKYM
ncbi:SatD family protein [Gracilimonas sp.]|uniref:SatD family protein n=1 Tax=Gracilimonas sp. TaxID=1974203 RepID=UPI003D138B4C